MSRKQKYRLALDSTKRIQCAFNAGISVMKGFEIPELEITDEESEPEWAGLYKQDSNEVIVVNGARENVVYHELSHCVYCKGLNESLIPVQHLIRHDVIFACINVAFYSFIQHLVISKNNKFQCIDISKTDLLNMSLYDVCEEPEPLLQGGRGLFFAERFYALLNISKNYYKTTSLKPEMIDIPLIAYTAKHLALSCAAINMDTDEPKSCIPYLTQDNIDKSIEQAMEICMFQKNCRTKNKDGEPLRNTRCLATV